MLLHSHSPIYYSFYQEICQALGTPPIPLKFYPEITLKAARKAENLIRSLLYFFPQHSLLLAIFKSLEFRIDAIHSSIGLESRPDLIKSSKKLAALFIAFKHNFNFRDQIVYSIIDLSANIHKLQEEYQLNLPFSEIDYHQIKDCLNPTILNIELIGLEYLLEHFFTEATFDRILIPITENTLDRMIVVQHESIPGIERALDYLSNTLKLILSYQAEHRDKILKEAIPFNELVNQLHRMRDDIGGELPLLGHYVNYHRKNGDVYTPKLNELRSVPDPEKSFSEQIRISLQKILKGISITRKCIALFRNSTDKFSLIQSIHKEAPPSSSPILSDLLVHFISFFDSHSDLNRLLDIRERHFSFFGAEITRKVIISIRLMEVTLPLLVEMRTILCTLQTDLGLSSEIKESLLKKAIDLRPYEAPKEKEKAHPSASLEEEPKPEKKSKAKKKQEAIAKAQEQSELATKSSLLGFQLQASASSENTKESSPSSSTFPSFSSTLTSGLSTAPAESLFSLPLYAQYARWRSSSFLESYGLGTDALASSGSSSLGVYLAFSSLIHLHYFTEAALKTHCSLSPEVKKSHHLLFLLKEAQRSWQQFDPALINNITRFNDFWIVSRRISYLSHRTESVATSVRYRSEMTKEFYSFMNSLSIPNFQNNLTHLLKESHQLYIALDQQLTSSSSIAPSSIHSGRVWVNSGAISAFQMILSSLRDSGTSDEEKRHFSHLLTLIDGAITHLQMELHPHQLPGIISILAQEVNLLCEGLLHSKHDRKMLLSILQGQEVSLHHLPNLLAQYGRPVTIAAEESADLFNLARYPQRDSSTRFGGMVKMLFDCYLGGLESDFSLEAKDRILCPERIEKTLNELLELLTALLIDCR